MKNKGIVVFLILLALIIVAVIAGDVLTNRPEKRSANPFEFSIDEFKAVDPELIHYRETKNFNIGFDEPAGIAVDSLGIYLVGDQKLKMIDFAGNLLLDINLPGIPKTVCCEGEKIYMVIDNRIMVYNVQGNLLSKWEHPGENSMLTSVTATDSLVFVADAGNRRVLKYSADGELLGQFEGKSREDALHGFIVPSPYFDLDINNAGELWVVNPGLHALENYTLDGGYRSFWESSGIKVDEFSGCCNPAHFSFMDDGRFLTSEKGLVRIKLYKPSGELDGVVAAPAKFKDEGEAPDIATDKAGNVYALDFDKKMVRVFEPK